MCHSTNSNPNPIQKVHTSSGIPYYFPGKKNLKDFDSKDLHLLHYWLTKSSNVEVRGISHHCGSSVIFHFLPELLALFLPFHNWLSVLLPKGHPWWFSGKESTCKAGDVGSIPGLGRVPGGGKGNPVQHSCLENPMGRGAWRATVHLKVAKSWTRLKQLNTHVHALLPKLSSEKNRSIWSCQFALKLLLIPFCLQNKS